MFSLYFPADKAPSLGAAMGSAEAVVPVPAAQAAGGTASGAAVTVPTHTPAQPGEVAAEPTSQHMQVQHPICDGCLVPMSVFSVREEGRVLRMHLLRVRQQLGKGGNSTVWRVGWSRHYAHLLINPQEPWAGISSIWQQVVLASALQEQEQQQQGDEDSDFMDQPDDLALKVARRYADTSDQHRIAWSYEVHQAAARAAMRQENIIALSVQSEFVIKAYGGGVVACSNGEELPCIMLEHAVEGSLISWVVGRKSMPGEPCVGMTPARAQLLMYGIVRGVSSLHNRSGTYHRDLKASNILLGGTPSHPVPKLADFGTCLAIDDYSMDPLPLTPGYRTPEHQPCMYQDMRIDTFMLGLLLLEMRFGMLPFGYYSTAAAAMQAPDLQPAQYLEELLDPQSFYNQGDSLTGREKLQADELEFLKVCLEPNVAKRPTVAWLLIVSKYLEECK